PLSLTLDSALSQIPPGQLHRLPPPQLTQALLNLVLTEGIGRLYLERRPTQGRVLWSKDGVVQAVLSDLSPGQIQSVINELKRLTHLPLLPTTQPKQADIERLYQGDRVLLRLRLMAGTHGEEATLQVLRGAALKFYEQQQIRQLGEEALDVAHTLQKRISAIRHQAQQTLNIEAPSARTLDDLMKMLKTMEEQIEQIMESSHLSDPKN
ncbi:pilus assembly protein PilB, partial [filamentous cyanobacterium CCP3]